MEGLRLTAEAIQAGAETLESNKLKPSQIDDLVSTFRGYLDELADNYDLETDLGLITDTATSNRAAKLAAYLLTLQDNDFANGGFAATNANRSGFNYSINEAMFDRFKYAFGLLYTIPKELANRYRQGSQGLVTSQGRVQRILD